MHFEGLTTPSSHMTPMLIVGWKGSFNSRHGIGSKLGSDSHGRVSSILFIKIDIPFLDGVIGDGVIGPAVAGTVSHPLKKTWMPASGKREELGLRV